MSGLLLEGFETQALPQSNLTLRGVRPRGLGRWLWFLLDRYQKPVVHRGAEYIGEVSR